MILPVPSAGHHGGGYRAAWRKLLSVLGGAEEAVLFVGERDRFNVYDEVTRER